MSSVGAANGDGSGSGNGAVISRLFTASLSSQGAPRFIERE